MQEEFDLNQYDIPNIEHILILSSKLEGDLKAILIHIVTRCAKRILTQESDLVEISGSPEVLEFQINKIKKIMDTSGYNSSALYKSPIHGYILDLPILLEVRSTDPLL